jgi:RNA polymerase sigma-70 factor (ECF subfamily)
MYRAGNAAAFDVLFDRHNTTVYAYARALLGDVHGAEDVLQESFLAVARTARQYRPQGAFRAWILRVARNRCLNRREAARARREVLGSSALETEPPPGREASPQQRAANHEQLAAVQDAMADLPERQREALTLYACEGVPYLEVAEIMAVPVNTVKTWIRRARAALAARVFREGGES